MFSSAQLPVYPFANLPSSVSIFIVGVFTVLYLAWKWALPKPIRGIPYNKAALKSIYGDNVEIAEIKKNGGPLRSWFAQQPIRHKGPIAQVFTKPLSRPTVIVSDFREVQDILLRRNKEFDKGGPMIDAFRGVVPYHHVCMETSEHQFKINRDLIKDLMTPSFLNDTSAPEIHKHALDLIEVWRMKAEIAHQRPIEAGRDLQMMTFDMTRDLSLGESRGPGYTRQQYDAVKSKGSIGTKPQSGQSDIVLFPPHQEGEDMMTQETIQGAIAASMPKPLPRLFHVFNNRKQHMRRAYAAKDSMIIDSIQLAIKRVEEGAQVRSAVEYIVRREIISAKKAGREPDFYSQPLQEELYGYLTAGYETTAAAFQWGIKYLAAHQDVQTELRRTIRQALPLPLSESRQPSSKELIKAQMPYLDAVVEEILRLATPIRSIFRVAKMDAMILGHHVPKGTQLILMVHGPDISMPGFGVKEELRSSSSQSYKDSVGAWKTGDEHLFNPDRWLKEKDGGNQRFDAQAGPTLAFSAGVRGCFGKRLAYLELKLVLALLVWNVEFLPLTEEQNSFDPMDGLGIKPKQCLARISMVPN